MSNAVMSLPGVETHTGDVSITVLPHCRFTNGLDNKDYLYLHTLHICMLSSD